MTGLLDGPRGVRVVAVLPTAGDSYLLGWGRAAVEGGIGLLAVPVGAANLLDLVSELADETANRARVGVSGVLSGEDVSRAVAAGAAFVLIPVCDPDLVKAARGRGLVVVCGAASPTEIVRARTHDADLVAVFPASALGGPAFFRDVAPVLATVPLGAWGGVDVESAPAYFEAGATAVVVDRGLFPAHEEPEAAEVIRRRAAALIEVCADCAAS
ncbi:MAG: hypothetical protein NZ898_15325 [Myxococcota bacterium]|nr:hypothetical protein [Myxococcota bacterium]MDW8363938.1 hypothetical protein [Myxococcales bacterium]